MTAAGVSVLGLVCCKLSNGHCLLSYCTPSRVWSATLLQRVDPRPLQVKLDSILFVFICIGHNSGVADESTHFLGVRIRQLVGVHWLVDGEVFLSLGDQLLLNLWVQRFSLINPGEVQSLTLGFI